LVGLIVAQNVARVLGIFCASFGEQKTTGFYLLYGVYSQIITDVIDKSTFYGDHPGFGFLGSFLKICWERFYLMFFDKIPVLFTQTATVLEIG
jgi:hypothetical protein